jgi:hypothetical protein
MLMDDPNAERGILDFVLEKGGSLSSALKAAEEGEEGIKRGEAFWAKFTRDWYQSDLERLPKELRKLHDMHVKGEAAPICNKKRKEKA